MHPLPFAFLERIRQQFPSEAELMIAALDNSPTASIRINKMKPGVLFEGSESVPWNEEGYFLSIRPRYTLDPKFHAGCYYPQESSSMVLQWVLKSIMPHDEFVNALDLCAAPGGKSLILSDFLNGRGRLVSNEIVRSRVNILNEVLVKWGASNVIVTNNRPADFGECGVQFDLVLVDAPCSGEGMFRKDPESRVEWNEGSAQMCSMRQLEILGDVLPSLREDGILIYSTCTFAKSENEDVINSLLNSGDYECIRLKVPDEWNLGVIDENGVFALRFLPHRSRGEGFFISALRRTGANTLVRTKPKPVFNEPGGPEKSAISRLGIQIEGLVTAPDGELYQSPFTCNELNTFASKLYVVQPGVHIGKVIRGDLIPGHALAMSMNAELKDHPIQLDEVSALAYLRGESIEVHSDNGWHRVAFQESVLGWIKVIGNRVNNYYPKEWRVKLKE
jgi:16S rRNA C967 or C1407 C5-methylase (RsmB/RsmF family)/NOL1/NOP2/fmu family ribosome biogenesis protein